ncbi:MAG: hypothetical protein ABFC94_10455 [Syntrophomonas sp.]
MYMDYKEYRWDGTLAYEGGIKNGLYFGSGRVYYPDGHLMYEGEFNGRQHGQGKLYYENGNLMYSGGFCQGRAHGTGILYNIDGSLVFCGEFDKGRALIEPECTVTNFIQ